ncbi:protein of unknown function (plasmid) [Caballeronia sp. S22]
MRSRPADALLALLDLVEVTPGAEICAAHERDCGNHSHDEQKDYYLIRIHGEPFRDQLSDAARMRAAFHLSVAEGAFRVQRYECRADDENHGPNLQESHCQRAFAGTATQRNQPHAIARPHRPATPTALMIVPASCKRSTSRSRLLSLNARFMPSPLP